MRKTLITTSIIAAVVAMPAFADPTAQELLDQKTVTSKYYVDTTKQDKITTDKVLFFEDRNPSANVYVPALVLTNAAGTALNGNTVGVLDRRTLSSVFDTNLNFYTDATYDNFVPTVRAVATELSSIWSELDSIYSDLDNIYDDISDINNDVDTINTTIETKQDKMTCAGYVDGHENDDDYCWLYSLEEPQAPAPSCEAYGEDVKDVSECCSGVLQNGTFMCGCNNNSDCTGTSSGCNSTQHTCTVKLQ